MGNECVTMKTNSVAPSTCFEKKRCFENIKCDEKVRDGAINEFNIAIWHVEKERRVVFER